VPSRGTRFANIQWYPVHGEPTGNTPQNTTPQTLWTLDDSAGRQTSHPRPMPSPTLLAISASIEHHRQLLWDVCEPRVFHASGARSEGLWQICVAASLLAKNGDDSVIP
jgi:hypothetical protein